MPALDVPTFPLWGSRLIEASAGTGKTWTIAALYVRLVLGHGEMEQAFGRPLLPAEILVMTFTRAATRELSDRIRARLLEAARCFRGEAQPRADDEFLNALMARHPEEAERRTAAWRLSTAAEGMDEASIHTIDAWCQRMLREHAFDSGSLFDEELVADEEALLTEAVQDYWRRQCYTLPEAELRPILEIWPDVASLQADVKQLLNKEVDERCATGTLGAVLAHAQQAQTSTLEALRAPWLEHVQAMQAFVNTQDPPNRHGWNGRRFSIKNITGWLGKLSAWASGDDQAVIPDLQTGWTRLTPNGLQEARAAGAPPMPVLPLAFEAFAGLQAALQRLPQPASRARLHAAASVARHLQALKRRANSFGFADMLERLDAALAGENGARLRERILAQYPVALIDEFQDTSPIQYRIFDRIYRVCENARDRALLLIGDPKQSIYGFRGADIHSYLQARQATEGRHYQLGCNYRSTRALVDVVNHAFMRAETGRATGAFEFKAAGADEAHNPLPFIAVAANDRPERWVDGQGARPALTLVYDLELCNADTIHKRFAERCAEQIVGWLNDPDNGFARDAGTLQRLQPKDIAILVHTGKEAAAVRRALQRRGVASVYLSDRDSVYRSNEARDLVHWLRGVATPQDATLVRPALALGTIGMPLDQLARIATQDEAFDEQAQALRELQQVWRGQGVLAMLRQALHRFDLAARWLREDGGERRLTNYLHLAELLQNASSELEGEQALVRWLMQQIAEASAQNEEQVVRLESDDDLVKVVTIHKSKGLEYPVVCLPYATSFRAFNARFVKSALLPRPDGTRELVLDMDDAAKARHEQERLREDLRLLYVAMTRARHALWLGFAALKIGKGEACQTHRSAAGYLFGGPEARTAADWLGPLQALAEGQPGQIRLQSIEPHIGLTRLRRTESATALRPAPSYAADFDRDWSLVSYSRLTRTLKPQGSALSPLRVTRPADDEAAEPIEAAPAPARSDAAIQYRFKRGPISGNFLHEQLEWLAGERFALRDNETLAARLQARCERAGHEEQAPALVEWLDEVVNTRLPGLDVALTELGTIRSELEFWLPARRIETRVIDRICRTYLLPGIERPALSDSTLHGMLMGFADLVFEHDGRYWLLDYKSNSLGAQDGDYGAEALAGAMARHRYDVQAAIYLLALHRLLKSRLGATYDPARQLGGAIYFFLRGIHGPAQGVCTLAPAPDGLLQFLQALDAMLDPAQEFPA